MRSTNTQRFETTKNGNVAEQQHAPAGHDSLPAGDMPCRIEAAGLRRLVEENADGILVVDVDGVIRFANPAAIKLFGRAAHGVIGAHFGIPLVEGEFTELDIRRPDGAVSIAEMRCVRTLWSGGPGTIVSLRDVTERKQLEAQLRQSQKMEALGRLAGGISHDFNNLLMSILCESSQLVELLAVQDPRRGAAETIRDTAQRAAELTRQLLTFSRKRVARIEVADVNDIVREVERMMRRLIGDSIVIQTELSERPAYVALDRGAIEQIILNLAINARDAMPKGGTLRLSTTHLHGAALDSDTPQNFVSLTVSDTGTGMSPDVQAHLFEPFFTTKPDGIGTGLGLSVVYGIVKQAHGRIIVQSELGAGSTFQVLIPAADETPGNIADIERDDTSRRALAATSRTPEAAAPSAEDDRSPKRRVLVVEDEEAVREVLVEILERRGLNVVATCDGAEAAALVHAGERFDAVVTDVSMPGMSGPQFVSRLQAVSPGTPVLFLSGYPKDEGIFEHVLRPSVSFLAKPFAHHELLAAIDQLLALEPQAV